PRAPPREVMQGSGGPAMERRDERNAGVAIVGRGVRCSIADTVAALASALREGRSGIRVRPDAGPREPRLAARVGGFDLAAWLDTLQGPEPEIWGRARKVLKNAPHATRLGVTAAVEAWREAGAPTGEPERTGLIVAGSNLNQDYIAENVLAVASGARRPNPKYALSYSDSNHVGCVSEILGLCGPGSTVSAASASGNAALFHAWHWVKSGVVDRCLVLGASTTLGAAELEGFSILGAASLAETPEAGCRPFDREANGFVWGEGAAAVVLERADIAQARGAKIHGYLLGASLLLDARHGPEPSADAEARAMRAALAAAGLSCEAIDYVNTHGTGSAAGDRAECEALRSVFGELAGRPWINATKALTGHCLSAAGVIEVLACLLQMDGGFVHGNPCLEQPIDEQLRFVGKDAKLAALRTVLSNGFGFGGFNSSVVIGKEGIS
ncbi:MAG: beta-ketoacyl synthase N-terminal-like domain-containing protein, partial [Verrucomicrobiota bacterium]